MKLKMRLLVVLVMAFCVVIGIMALYAEKSYADAEKISEVEVIVKAPAPGSDSNTEPVVSGLDGAPYEVEAKGWIGLDGTQEPPTYFKCEAGGKYTMWVTLKAGDNYDYSSDVSVKVTGGTLKEIVEVYNSDYSTYSALVIHVEVTCAAASKKANPLSVTAKTTSVSYAKLRKSTQYLKVSKVLAVSNAKGTITYTKLSGNSKITINKKTGKVTIKKGLKKSSYKVKVKVTAAGNSTFAKGSKTKTFTIKVK